MNSRREFLEVSSLAFANLIAPNNLAAAQTPAAQSAAVFRLNDYWNDLPNRMIAQVNAARTTRKAALAALQSSAAADERLAMVRSRVWDLIGGKLPETPLNPKTTGTIDRPAYRIEKIIFESQPEFYVTAHLYLPKSANKPAPAILAPLGHAPEGKCYPSYQTVFQNLARQGFVVFAFDPPGQGERLQYLDPATQKSRFGPTGEHDRFGWPALLIGSSTTQFEVWDGIRGLDYLLTRPEVDPARIGCCGHSGGGTQTMYLCALEPRIKAAVCVEGHTENLAGADYQPPGAYADAEQNMIGGLKLALDRGDLLAAFAPKPLLICYTTNDNGTTYSAHYVAGTEEIGAELRSLYSLYGAAEKVRLFTSPLPHDYDYLHRRSTYEWFNKWLLNGQSSSEETPLDLAPEASLWCTSSGQVLTSLGGRAAFQVNHDRLRSIKSAANGQPVDKATLQSLLAIPPKPTHLSATSLSTTTYGKVTIEGFEFASEPGIRIPGWFLKPASLTSPSPVILIADDEGKDRLFDQWPLVEQLTIAGFAICTIDLRTIGVTRPRLPSAGPDFYGFGVELAYTLVNLSLGSPLLGQQTCDVLRALDYLETRDDVNKSRISLFASGVSGLPALAAAALDARVRSLFLNRTLLTYESIVASKEYHLPPSAIAFGLLAKCDLPEICALVAPRPVWLVNPVGAQGDPVPLTEIQASYPASEKLSLRVQPGPLDTLLLEWAKKSQSQLFTKN